MALNLLHKQKSQDCTKRKTGAMPLYKRLGDFFYLLSYLTGKKTLALAHRVSAAAKSVFNVVLSEIFRAAGDFARNLSEFKRSRFIRGEVSFTRGIINFGSGVSDTLSICREAFSRDGFRSGLAVAGRFVRHAAARFFSERRSMLNYIAPVASVFVLALTVYFWSNSCFALQVTNDGKDLGVVASEGIYREAASNVEQNVSEASGSSFKLGGNVTYQMVLAKKSDLSDQTQIYENIVMKSCSGVKSGYGLYVDNRLIGASGQSGTIEAMLNNMTAKYKKDPQVQSVGFSQDVEVKSGVFPSDVFKSTGNIKSIVADKNTSASPRDNRVASAKSSGLFRISLDPLYVMNLSTGSTDAAANQDETIVSGSSNPTLTVKIVKNEVYSQQISHKVIKIKTANLAKGTTRVEVTGRNGSKQVVASVTYEGGEKTGEDVLSYTVTKHPVTEKILIGTKQTDSSTATVDSSDSSLSGSGNSSVVKSASTALGVNYVMGGSSYSGFDCSGLTMYMYAKQGVYLPHNAAEQSAYGSYVSESSLKSGDLVFFDTDGGNNDITHVGIYTGGGNFIDACSARPHCVKVDSLYSNYYSSRYMTARRIIK